MKFSIRIAVATIACYLSLAPTSTLAQIEWLNPEGRPGLQFEFTAGSFDKTYFGDDSYFQVTFPTSSWFVTGRGQFSPNISGIFELPAFFAKYKFDNGAGGPGSTSQSHFGFANPYFGIEVGKEGSSPLWNIGLRPPVISERNMAWAGSSQFISSHRVFAYINRVLTVSTNLGYRHVAPSGFGLRTTIGGQLAIPDEGDIEIFADLATNFWYRTSKLRLMTGLSSLCVVTESDIDFTDRLITSVSFSADITLGQVEPGLHVQFPIGDNLSETINNMYGVHIAYHFPTGESAR